MRHTDRPSQTQAAMRAPLALRLVERWEAERAQRGRTQRGLRVEVKLLLTDRDGSAAHGAATRRLIERWCLSECRSRNLNSDGSRIEVTLSSSDGQTIDEAAHQLLSRMRTIAEDRDCDLDAVIRHGSTGRSWS